MKIEINPEHLAHRLAMDKVEKKYKDLDISPYIENCVEYIGCSFTEVAQKDFDKHKDKYLKLIVKK